MVGSDIVEKDSDAAAADYRKLLSDNAYEISRVSSGRFLLSPKGMETLKKFTNFQQIRFRCSKPQSHSRVVDIATSKNSTGLWAVDYLLEKRNDKPPACGSYVQMPDDSSNFGKSCSQWYQGKWRNDNMYVHPFYINIGSKHNHFFILTGSDMHCDDTSTSKVGKWSFYVR